MEFSVDNLEVGFVPADRKLVTIPVKWGSARWVVGLSDIVPAPGLTNEAKNCSASDDSKRKSVPIDSQVTFDHYKHIYTL